MSKSIAEQYANWCVHFNGVMNDACKLGISYDSVRDESKKGLTRLPCFKDEGHNGCAKRQFPTQEEAIVHEEAAKKHIAEYLASLANGECPICKKVVKKRQVGHCVYGDCGHRLYQGRLRESGKDRNNGQER